MAVSDRPYMRALTKAAATFWIADVALWTVIAILTLEDTRIAYSEAALILIPAAAILIIAFLLTMAIVGLWFRRRRLSHG